MGRCPPGPVPIACRSASHDSWRSAGPLASLRSVSVVADDRKNYAVPASELLALVRGDAPAHDAPAGYAFTDFPFLLTVEAGVVVEARQIWLG